MTVPIAPVVKPLTVCITADPAVARAVGFGELTNTLVPASAIPVDAPMRYLIWDYSRFGIRDMPGEHVICQFVPKAEEADVIFVGSMPSPDGVDDLVEKMRAAIGVFPNVQRANGEDGQLTSLVVGVPFDDPVSGSRMIEAAHHLVKPEAVAHGTMVGEFGRELSGPGTRFEHIETRRSMYQEFFVVRALLVGPDSKYMTGHPAAQAAYDFRRGNIGRPT